MRRVIYHSRHALMMMFVTVLLLGGAVPLLFTAVAQLLFPTATHGSLVMKDGKPVGSLLIGQEFSHDRYFWGRLSATVPPYNAAASNASNLSMGNPNLLVQANTRMAHLPVGKKIPISLVTSSASGLDPHISPLAAFYQAERVAKARNQPVSVIKTLIMNHVDGPYLGFIGVPHINVLVLNMALDDMP